ncbi:MAG: V-type ATP synthase subunit E [Candidatus Hodarchaeota archaeon]
MKERFGNLGLYLIEKAKEEIRAVNRQALFQKAEIRKRYIERANENSLKIRKQFIKTYNQYLNNILSETLLKSKEKILDLKNRILEDLKNSINHFIKEKINKNYTNYINFLLNIFRSYKSFIDKSSKIIILFNSKDFDYFSKSSVKIKNLFKNDIEIQKYSEELIGGFKVKLFKGTIYYDYSIDNLINESSSHIQKNFSTLVTDPEIKDIEHNFEEFIQNKKLGIKDYLKDYDRI